MIAEVRGYVAGILTDLRVPVHAYPPGGVAPPFAALVPGYPYLELGTLGESGTVGLEVRIVCAAHAAQSLDQLIEDAMGLLVGTPVVVGTVDSPTLDPDTATYTAAIPVTVHWKD